MSIYVTILSFDADSDEGAVAPLVYRGSHILPSADSERGGWLELASIPSHCSADGQSLVDFMRFDVSPNEDGDPTVTVLLDRSQVLLLNRSLADWLGRLPGDE